MTNELAQIIISCFDYCAAGIWLRPQFQCLTEKKYGLFVPASVEISVWNEHAPAFIVYDVKKSYNRIGRPSARHTDNGDVKLYVDPDSPVNHP